MATKWWSRASAWRLVWIRLPAGFLLITKHSGIQHTSSQQAGALWAAALFALCSAHVGLRLHGIYLYTEGFEPITCWWKIITAYWQTIRILSGFNQSLLWQINYCSWFRRRDMIVGVSCLKTIGRTIWNRLWAEPLVTNPITTLRSGKRKITRSPWKTSEFKYALLYLWTREQGAMSRKVVTGARDVESGYFPATAAAWQLLAAPELQAECGSGCTENSCLHDPVSNRKQARAAGTWPPSCFCLPNLKLAHIFWQNLFCNHAPPAKQPLQVWVPSHIQHSKGYGFHNFVHPSVRLCV